VSAVRKHAVTPWAGSAHCCGRTKIMKGFYFAQPGLLHAPRISHVTGGQEQSVYAGGVSFRLGIDVGSELAEVNPRPLLARDRVELVTSRGLRDTDGVDKSGRVQLRLGKLDIKDELAHALDL